MNNGEVIGEYAAPFYSGTVVKDVNRLFKMEVNVVNWHTLVKNETNPLGADWVRINQMF